MLQIYHKAKIIKIDCSNYRNQLGCRTDKVSCHIIEQQIAIAIKNPMTPVERLLNSCAEDSFVNDLRDRIDNIVKRE